MRISRRTMICGAPAIIASLKLGSALGQSQNNPSTRQLFAWATPINMPGAARWDHTWTTTYDNRVTVYDDIQAVSDANESYWYAWGDFHARGGTPENNTGYLGSQRADLVNSKCIAAANADCRDVPAARGTIFIFGVDGVCHQLTNQILFSSGTTGSPPLTVANAGGYWASSFLYGPYGMNQDDWVAKKAGCSIQSSPKVASGASQSAPPAVDDFEARARTVLKGQDQKLKSLLELRAEMQSFISRTRDISTNLSAESLNARNQERLDEAARLLGPDAFKQIFGYPPEERIYLVDPSMMRPIK